MLEENEIFANALSGVQIDRGGNPTLRRNRIHDGKQDGVYVLENGEGIMEQNEISANTLSGVEITSGGNPTLRRNRIFGNKRYGIRILENSGGVFESNDLRGNPNAWDIASSSQANLSLADNLD
jgi:F-box protein 11